MFIGDAHPDVNRAERRRLKRLDPRFKFFFEDQNIVCRKCGRSFLQEDEHYYEPTGLGIMVYPCSCGDVVDLAIHA